MGDMDNAAAGGRVTLRSVPSELVTRQELAALMRVSLRTVDDLKAKGMPFVPWTGKMVRFRPHEAMSWAAEHGRREREAA